MRTAHRLPRLRDRRQASATPEAAHESPDPPAPRPRVWNRFRRTPIEARLTELKEAQRHAEDGTQELNPAERRELDVRARSLAVHEVALRVADCLDLHEAVAYRLTLRAATHSRPDSDFFRTAIPPRPRAASPSSAPWQEYVHALACAHFFWSRAQLLFALHLLLEAAGQDGTTRAAAAAAHPRAHAAALAVRHMLRQHVLDANVSRVSGPGIRAPPATGVPAPAGAAAGADAAVAAAVHHASTPVAGRGLVCSLLSGLVALTRDAWHARLARDPVRAARGDFDRVRVARCVAQLFRVFEVRLGPDLGLEHGQGGNDAESWPRRCAAPQWCLEQPWLPRGAGAGELGLVASVLRWTVTVSLRSSGDQTEASPDHQAAVSLLLALFAAVPDAGSALLAPRRALPHGYTAEEARATARLPPGAGDCSPHDVAGPDESSHAAPAANDGSHPQAVSLVSRGDRADRAACVVGDRIVDPTHNAAGALGSSRGSGASATGLRDGWEPWQACLELCIVQGVSELWRHRLDGMAGDAASQRRVRAALEVLRESDVGIALEMALRRARRGGAMRHLASLVAGPRFAATEVPGGWAVPRLLAVVAEVARLELDREAMRGREQRQFTSPQSDLTGTEARRAGLHPDVSDSALTAARLVTALVRADPAMGCRMLHCAGSVQDAWLDRLRREAEGEVVVLVAGGPDAVAETEDAEAGAMDEFEYGGDDGEDGEQHGGGAGRSGSRGGRSVGREGTWDSSLGGLPSIHVGDGNGVDDAMEMVATVLSEPSARRLAPRGGTALLVDLVRVLAADASAMQQRDASRRGDRTAVARASAAARSREVNLSFYTEGEEDDAALDEEGNEIADAGPAQAASMALTAGPGPEQLVTCADLPEQARQSLSSAVALLAAVSCGPLCADDHTCATHVAALLTGSVLRPPEGAHTTLGWTLGACRGLGFRASPGEDDIPALLRLPALLGRLDPRTASARARILARQAGAAAVPRDSDDRDGAVRAVDELCTSLCSRSGERLALTDMALLQALLCDQLASQHVEEASLSLAAGMAAAGEGRGGLSSSGSSSSHGGRAALGGLVASLLRLVRLPITGAAKAAGLKTLGVAARQPRVAEAAWKQLERAVLLPALTLGDLASQGVHSDVQREARTGRFPVTAALASCLGSLLAHPNSAVVTASLGDGVRDPAASPMGAGPYVGYLAHDVLPGLLRSPDGPVPAAWPAIAHVLSPLSAVLRGYSVVSPPDTRAAMLATAAVRRVRELPQAEREMVAAHFRANPAFEAAEAVSERRGLGRNPAASLPPRPAAVVGLLLGALTETRAADPSLDFSTDVDELWSLVHPGRPRPRSPAYGLLRDILGGGRLRSDLASVFRVAGGPEGAMRASAMALGWARSPEDHTHAAAQKRVAKLRTAAAQQGRSTAAEDHRRLQVRIDAARARLEGASGAAAQAVAPVPAAPTNPFAPQPSALAPAAAAGMTPEQQEAARAELRQLERQGRAAEAGPRSSWLPGCSGRHSASSDDTVWRALEATGAAATGLDAAGAALRGAVAREPDRCAAAAVWAGSADRDVADQRGRRAASNAMAVAQAHVAACEAGDPLAVPSSSSAGTAARASAHGTTVPLAVWRDRATMLACAVLEQASRLGPAFAEAARASGNPVECASVPEGLVRERAVASIARLAGFSPGRDPHVALMAARLLARIITPDADAAPTSLVLRQVAAELGDTAASFLAARLLHAVESDEDMAIASLERSLAVHDTLRRAPWPPLSQPDSPALPALADTAAGVLAAGLGLGVDPVLAGRPLVRDGAGEAGLVDSHVPAAEWRVASRLAARTLVFALVRETDRLARGAESLAPLLFGLADPSGAPANPSGASSTNPASLRRRAVPGILFASAGGRPRVARASGTLFAAVVRTLVSAGSGPLRDSVHVRSPQLALALLRIVRGLCSAPGAGARARAFVAELTADVLAAGSEGGGDASTAPGFFAQQTRLFFSALELAEARSALHDAAGPLSSASLEALQLGIRAADAPLPHDATFAERSEAAARAADVRESTFDYDAARIRKHLWAEAVCTLRTGLGEASEGLALDIAAMCGQRHAPLRQLKLALAALLGPAPPLPDAADVREGDGDDDGDAAAAALEALTGRAGMDAAAAAAQGFREDGPGSGGRPQRIPLLEALLLAAPLRESGPAVEVPPILTSAVLAYERAAVRGGEVGFHRVIGAERVPMYDETVLAGMARAAARRELVRRATGRRGDGAGAWAGRQGSAAPGVSGVAARAGGGDDDDDLMPMVSGTAGEARRWDELAAEAAAAADAVGASAGREAREQALAVAVGRAAAAVVEQATELAREHNRAVERLASAAVLLRGWRRLLSTLFLVPRARLALGAVLGQIPLETAFAGHASSSSTSSSSSSSFPGGAGVRHPVASRPADDFASWADDEAAATHSVSPAAAALFASLVDRAAASVPAPSPLLREVALACLPLAAGMRAGRSPAPITEHAEALTRGLAAILTSAASPGLTPRAPSAATRGVLYACLAHVAAACGVGLRPGHPTIPGHAFANAGLQPVRFPRSGAGVAPSVVGSLGLGAEHLSALPDEFFRRLRAVGGVHAPAAAGLIAAARGRIRARNGTAVGAARLAGDAAPSWESFVGGGEDNPLLHGAPGRAAAARAGPGAAAASAASGQSAEAAERARHHGAASFAACRRALDAASPALLDRLVADAVAGPTVRAADPASGGLRLPLAETRVAAAMLLGAILSAPGSRSGVEHLLVTGAVPKVAAAVLQSDAVEDAAQRLLGERPADGSIPGEDGAKRGRGRAVRARLTNGAGGGPAAEAAADGEGDDDDAAAPGGLAALLGPGAASLGEIQALAAHCADPAAADTAVRGLSPAAARDARREAQASVEACLWLLVRLAAAPGGAAAVVRSGAVSAVAATRWFRWARVEAALLVAGRLPAEAQATICARHRGRVEAVLRLLSTVAQARRNDAAAADEVRLPAATQAPHQRNDLLPALPLIPHLRAYPANPPIPRRCSASCA